MASSSEKMQTKKTELLDIMQFPRLDFIFTRYLDIIFLASVVIMLVFGSLLFDVRISEAGDDSTYLLEAMKFSRGESFPTFHGMFYSLMISVFIMLFGFNLVFFKILSLIFLLAHQSLFFLSFRKKVSPFLLGAVLLISSVSSGLLYYGSQTYTEAFFMFLQAWFIFLLIAHFLKMPGDFLHVRTAWKYYLALGAVLFMMTTTRNIGLVAIATVVIFFLIDKKYYSILYTFISYLVFSIPYSVYKKLVWNVQGSEIASQLRILLQKDPYNSSLGYETFTGFFVRLYENSGSYLSNIFFKEVGLRKLESVGAGILPVLVLTAILVIGLVLAFRSKRKVFQLVFIYLGLAVGVTLVSLNQMWSQQRLIIIFVPLLILCLGYTLAEISMNKNWGILRILLIILLTFSFLSNFTRAMSKVKKHQKILKASVAGDKYYGFSPDYRHFLSLSEWAAKNLPANKAIGSRKASMSFIYGEGRYFFPLYKLQFENTDSILAMVEKKEGHVFFIDDLILDQKRGPAINSLKVYLDAIITFDDAVHSMFVAGDDDMPGIDSLLNLLKIEPIWSVAEFRAKVVSRYKVTTTIIPDDLLRYLYDNQVYYLLDASLRVNPEEKSDQKINTIERYIVAISSKYPGIFKLIKQVGDNRDEPARLFQIDYSLGEERGWKSQKQ